MTALCPHCGYNLAADAVLTVDGWALDPRGAASFGGQNARLSKTEAAILFTLAKARGRTLGADTICARVSDAEGAKNLIGVMLCRIRGKCAQGGIPVPFEAVRGCGYRWCAADMAGAH